MKIVLISAWFFPEQTGGTEIYVLELARGLKAMGHEVLVAVPHAGTDGRDDVWEDVPIHRYPDAATAPNPSMSINHLELWIRREHPDLVHFHSWTLDAGLPQWQRIGDAGYPLVLTPHIAAMFCARGTMWRWGSVPCDGELLPARCAACYFQKRGLPASLGMPIAALAHDNPSWAKMAAGKFRTLLEYPSVLQDRKRELASVWGGARKIIAVSHWMRDALIRNGCASHKVALVRQGASLPPSRATARVKSETRFGFLGRQDADKGLDLLLEAFRRLPKDKPVTLEIATVGSSPAVTTDDDRIHYHTLPDRQVVSDWMRSLDALVVPSRTMETGPLVVYEALASGIPVVGAAHGGISELVQDGVNGRLFKPHSSEDLEKTLRSIVEHPETLPKVDSAGARTMRDVAREMESLYREIS